MPPKKRPMPLSLKSLIIVFISTLALLGIRLLFSGGAKEWIATLTVVVVLALLVASLIEVVRTR